ncbi:hypothetical protein PTKIN_Ptkin17bG0060500 [Pterospermum kingtungense]
MLDNKPTPPAATPTPLKMASIITTKRRWDVLRVHELFNEDEADLALKIPLSRVSTPNKLIWNDSQTGDMNAQQAYGVARTILGKPLPERSQRLKEEYSTANVFLLDQVLNTGISWKAPPAGTVKLNVDVAYSTSKEEASLGIVARNSNGEVLFSAAGKRWSILSSLQAELLAIHKEFVWQGSLTFRYSAN